MKKLLFSIAVTALFTINQAQNKTWNFSTFDTASYTATTTIDGLTLVPAGSDTGTISINTSTLATFTDTFAPSKRLQFGGNSYGSSTNPANGTTAMPTRRYLTFPVPGPGTIKVWARGGAASGRSIIISTESGLVLNNFALDNVQNDRTSVEYSYTGAAATLMISTGGGDNSLYKIEYIDAATMAAADFKTGLKANAFSSGNKIYVSNLESKSTQVSVYSANGSLVKTLKTSADTNFDINAKGVYIVNLKSEAGEKSVKVMVK